MAFTPLELDFLDDVLPSGTTRRKFRMINNADGTVSFEDVTEYEQYGSQFSSKEVIEERRAINEIYENKLVSAADVNLVTEEGFFVDALAVKELLETKPTKGGRELLWSGNLAAGKSVTLSSDNWKNYNIFQARTSDGVTVMIGNRFDSSGTCSIRFVGGFDNGDNSYVFKANTTIDSNNKFTNTACSMHKYLHNSSGTGLAKSLELTALWGVV